VQTSYADHEEFVEVRAENSQKFYALEQRPAWVARLIEHSFVEGQPGQLATQEELPVVQITSCCEFLFDCFGHSRKMQWRQADAKPCRPRE
jgi:hypothetical protein